jgi:hypothetical protein
MPIGARRLKPRCETSCINTWTNTASRKHRPSGGAAAPTSVPGNLKQWIEQRRAALEKLGTYACGDVRRRKAGVVSGIRLVRAKDPEALCD